MQGQVNLWFLFGAVFQGDGHRLALFFGVDDHAALVVYLNGNRPSFLFRVDHHRAVFLVHIHGNGLALVVYLNGKGLVPGGFLWGGLFRLLGVFLAAQGLQQLVRLLLGDFPAGQQL